MIKALTPVLLDGTLPKDGVARQEAIQEVVDAFDRALAGLSPAVMVGFFEKMAKENGDHTLGIAISSHPADAERIRFFQDAAAQR